MSLNYMFFFNQFHGEYLLQWTDRQENNHPVFNLGKGLCNHKEPTKLIDEGQINKKSQLPVMGFDYGPLSGSAKFTIGSLK